MKISKHPASKLVSHREPQLEEQENRDTNKWFSPNMRLMRMDRIEKTEMIDLNNLTRSKSRLKTVEKDSRKFIMNCLKKLTNAQTTIFNLNKKELN